MSFIDEMVDESETLTDEDKAALDAEERGETYEPDPEMPPELVEERRELSRQLAEERERFARLDERRIAAEEAVAPSRPQGPSALPSSLGPRPDADIDPFGADIWDARRETELVRLQIEQDQANRQQQEFANWINNDAAQFRAKHPDYDTATDHAYKFRLEFWKELGLPEAHARVIVDREAAATAMLAKQTGKSAAASFYELGRRLLAANGAPARQRQPAPMRAKPQARRAVDIDAMSESQLEHEIRRNPRGITRAIERLEIGR
jgi:hypothetical protein